MIPTSESLRTRLKELTEQRQQLLNNVNAYNGAIQECERMLAEMESAKEPVAEPVPGE